MAGRLPALRRFAKGRRFDLALAHGSHEAMLVARSLGIAGATAHDYEFATTQHQLGLRAATRVVFPDAVPPDRLARLGAKPPKLRQYPGIEEEYYLADFEPDPAVLDGIDPGKRARRRADAAGGVALPPPRQPALPGRARPARPRRARARGRPAANGASSGRRSARSGCRRCTLPEHAVDAQSLVASRRPRRLGRRDDEPRGSRARHARLHDVRGPARRRRRDA